MKTRNPPPLTVTMKNSYACFVQKGILLARKKYLSEKVLKSHNKGLHDKDHPLSVKNVPTFSKRTEAERDIYSQS